MEEQNTIVADGSSEYVCEPMEFFKEIKDSLRYESELADRRLKFLLTIQACLISGYAFFCREKCDGAIEDGCDLCKVLSFVGIAVGFVMLRSSLIGFRASSVIIEHWKTYCKDVGIARQRFPPAWGVRKSKQFDNRILNCICWACTKLFEYYIALPIVAILTWVCIAIAEMS